MAYDFFIGKMLFPVCPDKINVQINGRNETYVLINDGEINMLKAAGLTSGRGIRAAFKMQRYIWIIWKA